jgi:hypothetical protein
MFIFLAMVCKLATKKNPLLKRLNLKAPAIGKERQMI